MNQATRAKEILGLRALPVAIGFLEAAPAGVEAWNGPAVAAGCVFWAKAQAGQTFYTIQSDHYNCAVGAYTHSMPLPVERAPELEATIGFMVENNYLAMAEVPGIPTLPTSPQVVAYAPADNPPFRADVVVVAASPAQAMLLYEAALKAGAGNALTNVLGRPACAILSLTLHTNAASISLGCKGNRTFTGIGDNEMYVCIQASQWDNVVKTLAEIRTANQCMATYYEGKREQFATAG